MYVSMYVCRETTEREREREIDRERERKRERGIDNHREGQ